MGKFWLSSQVGCVGSKAFCAVNPVAGRPNPTLKRDGGRKGGELVTYDMILRRQPIPLHPRQAEPTRKRIIGGFRFGMVGNATALVLFVYYGVTSLDFIMGLLIQNSHARLPASVQMEDA